MSKANYWQRGETLDFANDTGKKIENGTIIIAGTIVGVAGDEIANGSVGPLEVTGVFSMPKTAKTEVITIGDRVYFDGTGITKSTDNGETGANKAEYTLAGYAANSSAATEEKVLVKLAG